MSMQPSVRDMMIEEDLGWLAKLEVHNVDGKLMLGEESSELPFNVSHIMQEDEFVRKYLLAFALGNSLGINYFPLQQWFEFTFNGTRAVLVVKKVEETGKFQPVLLVPPLITHSLTDEDRILLRRAAEVIYVNYNDSTKKNNLSANLEVSQVLADPEVGLKAKPMTYADLINPEYFAEKKVIPEVEQKVYYIRDIICKGEKVSLEDLDKARDIFFRDHNNDKVTPAEWQFISKLTKGEFIVEGKEVADTTSSSAEPKQSDDPLEC